MSLDILRSTDYRGILDLEPREPIAAVLSAGRKAGAKGVAERDRYHLVDPHENDQGIRPYHPGFKAFNDADADRRRIVHGFLIHAMEEECWHWQNAAFLLPGWPKPPSRRNACVGGLKGGEMLAKRYCGQKQEEGPNGSEVEVEDWREIPCPNRLCEFQQGDASPCGPAGRLYFQLRWPQTQAPLPCVETMYETHGANTVANVCGFFHQVHQQAAHLGVTRYSLFGLPFILTMAQRRKKGKKWWETHMTADCVLQEFFLRQRREVSELEGELPERRRLVAVQGDPPAEEEARSVQKPAGGIAQDADIVDAEAEEVQAPQEEPADAPDDAARWETLKRKAKALGLTEADLEEAVAAVTDGGIFPDLEAGRDVEVEGELQRLARGKK